MLFGKPNDFLRVAVSISCVGQCTDHTLWTTQVTTVLYHDLKWFFFNLDIPFYFRSS